MNLQILITFFMSPARWSHQVWTVSWVVENVPVQHWKGGHYVGSSMTVCIVQQNNSLWQPPSLFFANGWWQFVSHYVEIPRICNCDPTSVPYSQVMLTDRVLGIPNTVMLLGHLSSFYFLNISVHLYTLLWERAVSCYWAHKHVRFSASLTPSAHKVYTSDLCSCLVQT
jgi:hypothetical protein